MVESAIKKLAHQYKMAYDSLGYAPPETQTRHLKRILVAVEEFFKEIGLDLEEVDGSPAPYNKPIEWSLKDGN